MNILIEHHIFCIIYYMFVRYYKLKPFFNQMDKYAN